MLLNITAFAQQKADTVIITSKDSVIKKDSIKVLRKDTLSKANTYTSIVEKYPVFTNEKPTYFISNKKINTLKNNTNNYIFYSLLLITAFVGFLKFSYGKYFSKLFGISFQTTQRKTQTKEQLNQSGLASALFNILFILSGSIVIALIVNKTTQLPYNIITVHIIGIIVLSLVYIFKLIFTNVLSFVFNKPNFSNTYSFKIFYINKLIGILLVPIAILIAFSNTQNTTQIINITYLILSLLLVYRFVLCSQIFTQQFNVSTLHFFMYFCGVEILPIVIILKVLYLRFL